MTALLLNGPKKKKDTDTDMNPRRNGDKWNEKCKEITCN